MMKRKMAVAMAGAMVATTVAPVVSQAMEQKALPAGAIDLADAEAKAELMKTVKGYLDKTYTENEDMLLDADNAGKCAYTVTVKGKVAANYAEFVAIMDTVKVGDEVRISIEDKGSREVSGELVDWDNYAYSAETNTDSIDKMVNELSTDIAAGLTPSASNGFTSIVVPDASNLSNVIKLEAGDIVPEKNGDKVDLKDANHDVNGDGNLGTKILSLGLNDAIRDFSKPLKNSSGYIYDFEAARIAVKEKETIKDIEVEYTATEGAVKKTLNASELIKEGRYTREGNELAKELYTVDGEKLTDIYGNKLALQYVGKSAVSANELIASKDIKEDKITISGQEEKMYNVNVSDVKTVDSKTSEFKITVSAGLGYAYENKLDLKAKVEIAAGSSTAQDLVEGNNVEFDETKLAELTFTGTFDEVKELYAQIATGNTINNPRTVTTGDFTTTLAGTDRYETAIEVSKSANAGTNNNVVLVSGESLADGLTATPFAKALGNAPILLTQSGKLTESTKDEIKRLEAKNVYIVGGENSVSPAVAEELAKMRVKVDRVKGDDRCDTSYEVAKRIATLTKNVDEVFVAQGYAMADALSISAEAAKKTAPIVLTEKTSMSKDIETFIRTNNVVEAFVAGGDNTIAPELVKEIDKVSDKVTVFAGTDRQDTNAKVLRHFGSDEQKAVVVKSDDKNLVDALAAGVYAAQTDSQLVIATDNLSASQKIAIEDTAHATKDNKTTVQVGYGVSEKVIKVLKSVFK
ncbi:cell wall-binding repeat-containing protein [Romboutsia sp. 1001285H_161024_C4]|uniref:cell wall-binding repeat-containing protein n=1 Tax=Romboutsia sp. 1001285H_161024_C4 TaxID=2787109 RepID=UPI001897F47E|nr:cell wall-binding repeat-containing protein [Romboutsia sp. 1001285H_161024_C4]